MEVIKHLFLYVIVEKVLYVFVKYFSQRPKIFQYKYRHYRYKCLTPRQNIW